MATLRRTEKIQPRVVRATKGSKWAQVYAGSWPATWSEIVERYGINNKKSVTPTVNRWLKEGRLKRVARGLYDVVPEHPVNRRLAEITKK